MARSLTRHELEAVQETIALKEADAIEIGQPVQYPVYVIVGASPPVKVSGPDGPYETLDEDVARMEVKP